MSFSRRESARAKEEEGSLEYNIDGFERGDGSESVRLPRENTRARTPHYLLNHRVAAKSQAAAPLGNSFCLNTAEAGLKIAPLPPPLSSARGACIMQSDQRERE